MNKELILTSDVLDIIFDNRNKAYGAYPLRKFYNNRLLKAMGFMLIIVIALSAFSFLPKKKTIRPKEYIIKDHILPPLPDKLQEKKPIKKNVVPPSQHKISAVKMLNRIMIVPEKDSSDKLIDIDDSMVISNQTIVIRNPHAPVVALPVVTGNVVVPPAIPAVPVVDVTKPIDNPEVRPEYPGGMSALKNFLEKNLTNPEDLPNGEPVEVKIKFVVGYDGKLQSFQVIRDGGNAFNTEVIRVLKKMPEWIPGKTNGKNVAVFYTIPVKFVVVE